MLSAGALLHALPLNSRAGAEPTWLTDSARDAQAFAWRDIHQYQSHGSGVPQKGDWLGTALFPHNDGLEKVCVFQE